MNRLRGPFVSVALAAGAHFALAPAASAGPHDALIQKHAAANDVPETLVRRVIQIESRGNPRAVSKGNYGLMQIRLGTARSMGYSGDARGLLDADTNMTYAVRYLANAYRAAGCNISRAVAYYQRGFYKKPQMRCGASSSSRTAEPRDNALAALSTRSDDVLKPRVVHIEKITRLPHAAAPHQTATTKQPRGAFDPVRIAPPLPETSSDATVASVEHAQASPSATQPATAVLPMPRPRPLPRAETSRTVTTNGMAVTTTPQPTEAERIAALDSQSVPLPAARPSIAPTAGAKPVHRATRRSGRHARPKAEETPGIVSFLDKLAPPDKKSRKAKTQPQAASPYAAPVY